PGLIAECHVLHRLLVPRHPPNALFTLEIQQSMRRDKIPAHKTLLSNTLPSPVIAVTVRHRPRNRQEPVPLHPVQQPESDPPAWADTAFRKHVIDPAGPAAPDACGIRCPQSGGGERN